MKITGLIGDPVAHSLSPAIHQYWINAHGIDAAYELFPTPAATLKERIAQLLREGITGFNITVPHKQAAIPYLGPLDPIAERIGAVNTVTLRNGIFHCSNTDAYGFITNLKEGLADPQGSHLKKVLVLGAGGAARAILVALSDAGARHIVLTNRTEATAAELAREFRAETVHWADRHAACRGTTLLVNATSLGMASKTPLEMDLSHLPMGAAVHDIVYAPLETPLLAAARVRGNKVVDGLGMLLYQAQAAFEQWHGIRPVVDEALRAHVVSVRERRDDRA